MGRFFHAMEDKELLNHLNALWRVAEEAEATAESALAIAAQVKEKIKALESRIAPTPPAPSSIQEVASPSGVGKQ